MSGGQHKLLLTKTQFGHFSKAKSAGIGIQLTLWKAAVNDMIKSGGIFPLGALAPLAIPALKAIGLGAVGSKLMGKVLGSGYKKKRERGSDYREASTQDTTGMEQNRAVS